MSAAAAARVTRYVLLAASLAAAPAAADEDTDLSRIPTETAPATSAPTSSKNVNYIGDALSFSGLRDNLAVPLPPPTPASWENWLFLDSRDEWNLGEDWRLDYSGRLNFRTSNALTFPNHDNVLNEMRELFVQFQPNPTTWIELGRVNIRNGVALGYNPTDFFRPRTVIDPLTADPSVLREDRLGTLMVSVQSLWQFGSIQLAYAPRVTLPTAIYTPRDEPSFDPGLDRTNAQDRFLAKASLNIAPSFNPEVLFYHAGTRSQIGANLTAPAGHDTVLYLEWAGGVRSDIITDAFSYGQTTGTLPASVTSLLPNDPSARFMNDLAVGASYATENRMTFNLEYHFHQAGFSSSDWRNWFAASAQRGSVQGVNAALWYIRSYAQDQQEPVARHTAFLRFDWQDAFIKDVEVTALASIDLQDGSGFMQTTVGYNLSRAWTVSVLASGSYGGRRSDFGSIPVAETLLLRAARYF
ncbi:MAG TPA: hypothetical protein VGM32_14375 [Rhodopila sp.]|jgi:hypothetical protein